MKTQWTLGLAIVCVATSHAGPSVQQELDRRYREFSKAWEKKDLGPTYAAMTDDFTAVGVDPSGKTIGREQMIVQTKQLLTANHITWPRRIISLKVDGSNAIAVVDGHFTGMLPDAKGGNPHKLELIATTKDTWVLVGRMWRFKRMEIVRSSMKMDGKEIRR